MQNEIVDHSTPSLSKSTLALVVSNYGVAVFNVAFSMITLRLLTRTEYAVTAVLEILSIGMSFTHLGLNTVFLQLAPAGLRGGANPSEALGLIKVALFIRLIMVTLLTTVMMFFTEEFSIIFLKTPMYSHHLKLLFIGAAAAAIMESFMHISQAAQQFYRISRWTFLTNFFRSPTGLLLFYYFGFWGYLAGNVGSILLSTVIIGWKVREYWLNSARMAPCVKMIRYGLPFNVRTFFRLGFGQWDMFVIGVLLTPDVLAIYAVARRFISYINQANEALMQPLLMRAAALRNASSEERADLYEKALRFVPLIIIPICAAALAGSPWLMRVIGGEKYADGWPILVLLCLAQIAYTLYSVSGMFVYALRQPSATLAIESLAGGTNFIIAPILIMVLGMSGVALGQIAGFLMGWWLARYYLRPYPEMDANWGLLWRFVVPTALAVTIVGGGQALFFRLWIVPFYFALGALLFVYAFAPRLTREEWTRLRGLFPGKLAAVVDLIHKLLVGTASVLNQKCPS